MEEWPREVSCIQYITISPPQTVPIPHTSCTKHTSQTPQRSECANGLINNSTSCWGAAIYTQTAVMPWKKCFFHFDVLNPPQTLSVPTINHGKKKTLTELSVMRCSLQISSQLLQGERVQARSGVLLIPPADISNSEHGITSAALLQLVLSILWRSHFWHLTLAAVV